MCRAILTICMCRAALAARFNTMEGLLCCSPHTLRIRLASSTPAARSGLIRWGGQLIYRCTKYNFEVHHFDTFKNALVMCASRVTQHSS